MSLGVTKKLRADREGWIVHHESIGIPTSTYGGSSAEENVVGDI